MAAPFVANGCREEGRQQFIPVEGVLTVNGVPAPNASLAFHPLAGGAEPRCPVGRTDTRGRFRLTTDSAGDGAPAGDYAVTIVWPDESRTIDDCVCSDPVQHDRLKGFYASADQTEFRVTIRPPSHTFRFDAWRYRSEDAPESARRRESLPATILHGESR